MTDGTRYDVCIVGAGPHALSVLSALRTPAALLKEHDHKRMAFNAAKAKVDKCLGPRVCVIDPAGKWMHEWNERFAGLDITYLRSPAWAHPDAFSQEALIDFAFQQNRLDELKEVDFQKTSLQGIPEVDSGYFRLPGTKLFHDFCKKHSARLPHDLVCGRVTDIRNVGSEYDYDIIFEGCPGSKTAKSVRAKQIVLALGAFGPPNIPTEFGCIFGLTDAQGCPRIVHTGNWRALKSLNEVLERPQRDVGRPVLVIGGGLSAVQAALLSVKHGRHTVLCSRRPLVERHYDLPLEWMDRRYADGGRGKKMFHFFAMSKTERLEYVKNIRGGGTVPPDYMQALQAARSKGLEILVNKVRTAVAVEGGVCVEFENGRVLTASYVVLGTGGMRDCTKVPLLEGMIRTFNLPVQDGLPLLSDDLLVEIIKCLQKYLNAAA